MQIRKRVIEITVVNESELSQELQRDIDLEMSRITLERGREILQEVDFMIFQGWDISLALVFDSFTNS